MFDIDRGIVSNSTTNLNYTLPTITFLSIALYNVVELTFIIFTTFRNRHGLYFWSFCVATFGIIPYSLGFLFKGLGINDNAVFVWVTMIVFGWTCLVTGQSVVLYSRLHLVDRNKTHLRFVLVMIIVNGILIHTTVGVLIYGSNSNAADLFVLPYSIAEKVQVSMFFVQECIISGLYIAATLKFFRNSTFHASATKRRILWHLIIVNVIVILLDITILGLEYSGLYELQTSYKGMVYSVKLKLEFSILNKLMDLTKARSASNTTPGGQGMQDMPCPSCREDFIFDGSQQMHTCLQGTMALSPLDGGGGCGGGGGGGGSFVQTQPRTRTRKGSVKIGADKPPATMTGSLLHPNDGIMVMTTTSVNVSREDDFERQWRGLRRISSESEPHRGSLDITTSSVEARKSASSSEAALTKDGT